MNIEQIRELLPHRYPFLLVDRVLEVSEQEIVGIKLVSANEPFFQGHFPDLPIMPGVLILEALAQLAGLWVMVTHPENRNLMPALAGVDKARFRRPVRPGDLLQLHVSIERARQRTIRAAGTARVDGEVAASAGLLASLVEWVGEGT
jgi:3-hydroxyacyl-[acyl-carrier-protein] dehydratase